MPRPVKRLFIPCIISMDTILLRERNIGTTQYTDVIATDQRLVTDTTSTYLATLQTTEILTLIVATATGSPQGIPRIILPVPFMLEATLLLPPTSRCSTRQPLKRF